jgi:SAM-dependent methyltransferase
MDSAQWRPRFRFGQAFAAPSPADDGEADAPRRLARILEDLPGEVVERFSGCGSPVPEAIGGRRLLDLGCGTGRDAFLCANLAGPEGFVMGLDREPELLAVARRNVEEAMSRFGHPEPNVAFRQGLIEDLAAAELEDEGFDVVISNRALNLVPRKLAVLQEVHRVLKPGGEFYFADVYTDRRLPDEIGSDPEVLREQLGGALYVGDFVRMARRAGFADPRIVSRSPLTLADPDLHARLGGVVFWTVTFRLFKIPDLEDGDEDYGQAACYRGTIPGCAHRFCLDAESCFEAGRAVRVGGNTDRILRVSRFAPHFEVLGDRSRHFGPFVRGSS